MILASKQPKVTNYYVEIYTHTYINDCLYGMVKNGNETVLTITFKLHDYPMVLGICKGVNRRLLLQRQKNKSLKDLCKLRIRNRKPIRVINYT
jgi:hypothetical protein